MFENFVYDDISSDEYGVMCVSFDPIMLQSMNSQDSELKTERSGDGDLYHIISQQYSSPLTFNLQLINRNFSPISSECERAIKKWLCQRGKYKPFTILDKRFADIWFYANFSNPQLKVYDDVVGMEFVITTNAPYGFSELYEDNYKFSGNSSVQLRYVESDEDLLLYPDMMITMKESGSLTVTNLSVPDPGQNALTIDHLVPGETVTIHGNYPDVCSSAPSHNILTDSNRKWIYLLNGNNTLHTDKACDITLSYREYRRIGVT